MAMMVIADGLFFTSWPQIKFGLYGRDGVTAVRLTQRTREGSLHEIQRAGTESYPVPDESLK